MFTIETPRLILAATPVDVLETRLTRADFDADVPVVLFREGRRVPEVLQVHFPPEWPGDALPLFPEWAGELRADPSRAVWSGTMIERATRVAVGQMGFKGLPDESGMIELGYGVNRSCWNRGYATEMARALVDWALGQPMVKRVTAMCLDNNAASIRVLEKTGFRRIGRRTDEEGMLICWERLRASRGLRSGGAG